MTPTKPAVPGLAHVVILGAGHAGGSAALNLRQYGFEGAITLLGDEPHAPYQRPPLSKAWLKGEADLESLLLRPESAWAEQDIAWLGGTRAEAIDPVARVVRHGHGEMPYDALIMATGSRARPLEVPGTEHEGVLSLRSIADAEALKKRIRPGSRVVIVGGGYVGLEAAASARSLGAEVTVMEREPRCLYRVASEALALFFEARHRSEGVSILTGARVTEIIGAEGHVSAVVLDDGREIAADLVLVGIGGLANDDLARAAGLECVNGIVVDELSRTSAPDIHAIGDVTWRPLPLYEGRHFRLESVPNALEQARQVAAHLTGRPAPAPEVPWFWSDQYDLKLQIAGLPFDADRVIVREREGALAVFHLMGDTLRAVEAVNAPPEFMMGRQLIARRTPVDPHRLADPSVSMKEVAK